MTGSRALDKLLVYCMNILFRKTEEEIPKSCARGQIIIELPVITKPVT